MNRTQINADFQDYKKIIKTFCFYLSISEYICVLVSVFIFLSPILVNAEPSLLWRMTFDSPIVKTSDLSDFVAASEKGASFPLKTVMTEKSIYLLDNMGKISKKIPLKDYAKAAMSDDGTTIATMTGREISISDLDNQIHGIVNIADPQPVVLPQHVTFELSPDGEYIVVISNFTNTIYFHNKKGKLLSKHNFEDLRGAEIRFSKNSRYVAIHVPNWGEGKTNGYLLFFNRKGKNLWRFDHKGVKAKFDISSDGNSVVLAAEDRLYSLNKKGKAIYEKELVPGDMDIALSDDGAYVAVTKTTDHSISLLDNRNGKKLWDHNVDGFDPINSPFSSLDISGNGHYISVAVSKDWTRRNKESFFYLFNKSGRVVFENTFEEPGLESGLSSDGKCALIRGNKEAYLYRTQIFADARR